MPIQNTSNVPPNYFVVKKNLEACPQPFGEESIMSTQRQSQRAECSLHTCGRGGFSQGAVVSPCILKKESDSLQERRFSRRMTKAFEHFAIHRYRQPAARSKVSTVSSCNRIVDINRIVAID